MDFQTAWLRICGELNPGTSIRNWTVLKGYLGDEFTIARVQATHIDINSPNAETIQRVNKKDVEFMYANWPDYCSGKVKRQALVKQTRVSKYTISIIKHIGL